MGVFVIESTLVVYHQDEVEILLVDFIKKGGIFSSSPKNSFFTEDGLEVVSERQLDSV